MWNKNQKSSHWSIIVINSKYRNCEVAVALHSLKLCCFGFVTSCFWASLFNFHASIAIYCCIFVIFMVDTYMRISSVQKVDCLEKAEQKVLEQGLC